MDGGCHITGISITGVPNQLIGRSLLIKEISPRVMYHLGLLGILGSYILVSVFAVAGWMRDE